jgi:hypothetical protein
MSSRFVNVIIATSGATVPQKGIGASQPLAVRKLETKE